MATVVVIGAGVDKTPGLGMPLAAELVPELAQFSENEGREIERTIRSFLPSLRFSFNKLIKDAIESMAKLDENQSDKLIKVLQQQAERGVESDQKLARLLIKLFSKLKSVQEGGKLDDETVKLVQAVFGKEILEEIEDESIFEFAKLSFSDSFKVVMRKVFERALQQPDNPIYSLMTSWFLDIETLLVEKFLGFYNEKLSDIKKYLYISWMLWAYLRSREVKALSALRDDKIPFYSNIPSSFKVISFNYTSFLTKARGDDGCLYFHGSLRHFLRMDHRDLVELPQFNNTEPIEATREVLNHTLQNNLDLSQAKYVIPAIIPPLRIKPVLSHEFIKTWYTASQWIGEASKIIIIGYSFNYADEHFNDMLRSYRDKKVYVVDPRADNLKHRLSMIFGFQPSAFSQTTFQGKVAYKCHNLTIIQAKAHELELEKEF